MDPDELAAGPARGFRLLVYAADLWIYQQALRRCFRTVRRGARRGEGGGVVRFAAVPICYDGSPVRLPARRSFRAGPLTFEYEGGELRYVRLGDREVIRRLYVAVRDHDWGTVPGWIVREYFEAGPDRVSIHFEMAAPRR